MFERCAKGCSYKEIIDELDSLGFHTRAGNRFSYSSLNALLRNDKYYGTFVYNRIGGKKKKHRVLNEFFDEVRNECAIPPIITKKLFDRYRRNSIAAKEYAARTRTLPTLYSRAYCSVKIAAAP